MAIPKKDALLVPYLNNMSARLTASPTTFGLVAGQAAELYSRKQAFVTAYDTLVNARADGTYSQSQTADKDFKKGRVLEFAREIYALVSANKSVTDANKILIGVHVSSGGPSPVPAPTVRPGAAVKAVVGRNVSVTIFESAASPRRRKPAGSVQAYVYTFVGAEYPADPTFWQFQGPANTADFSFTLPDSVPNGAQVWICAAWVNRRGETGPVSVPISTNIQGGGASAQQQELKIAA